MVTTRCDDFRPGSPFRPLNWRYMLAKQLANGPLPPHLERFVDDTVRAVAAALVSDQADPAVVTAVALADGPPLDIAELEGRVIGGQSDAEIADAMGLSEDVVAAYIAVFFDIWHLVKYPGAFRAIAIGHIDHRPPTPEEAVRRAGFQFDGQMAGLVAAYFRLGFGDGRRITRKPGFDSEACKTTRSIRNWLCCLGPPKDPIVTMQRWAAVRNRELRNSRPNPSGARRSWFYQSPDR